MYSFVIQDKIKARKAIALFEEKKVDYQLIQQYTIKTIYNFLNDEEKTENFVYNFEWYNKKIKIKDLCKIILE